MVVILSVSQAESIIKLIEREVACNPYNVDALAVLDQLKAKTPALQKRR